jgi:hypothetical protein
MRSASTARPASPPDAGAAAGTHRRTDRPTRRRVGLVASLILAVTVLAGCASDRAYDQDRARETAETTSEVITGVQSTYVATRYGSPTATATATAVSPGVLHEIGLTTSVGPDGQPDGFVTGIASNAGRVYVAADIEGLADGAAVGVVWSTNVAKVQDRRNVGESSITVTGGRHWVAVPFDLDGSIQPGDIAISLYVDGQQIGTLGIDVLSPGSAPRGV